MSTITLNPTQTTHKPSVQQQAVIDWGLRGKGHLNLVARAGCGKTSTLLSLTAALTEQAKKQGKPLSIFIGAYNKAIATEIKAKLEEAGHGWTEGAGGRRIPPMAEAGTLHSVGFRTWIRLHPAAGNNVDEKKCSKILDDLCTNPDKADLIAPYREAVLKLVSWAKQRAFGVLCSINDHKQWYDMVDHFGVEEDLPEDADMDLVVRTCVWVYQVSLKQCATIIDSDDMILAPLYFKARFYQKDFVMIDEAQDTNPARRALALALLKPGTGRLVAVGDPAQAIYGFTGADSDSMSIIKQQLNSKELPLNMTYRCGRRIVELAQTWVPDIKAAETNAEGVVRNITTPEFLTLPLKPTDAILCRKNAPLVDLAFRFIRQGTPCRVEGREIGQGLISITNKWKLRTISALLNKLDDYRAREIQRYQAKGQEEKAANLEDKLETLKVLCERLQGEGRHDINDLRSLITSMFGNTTNSDAPILTLCSVHKSKGREWNTVYLLGRNRYMPSKWARKDWQVEQEMNLMYVAVTRAKSELVEVEVVEADNLG
jgi:superfamily I DNA/RNA helicase